MLMSLGGLFANDLVEWADVSHLPSRIRAGARHINELLSQWVHYITKWLKS